MANNALVKIQMKRASTSDWNRTTNTGSAWQGYLLRQAEFGIEVFPDNSVKIKIGDGNTIWKDLKYVAGETGYFVNSLPALSEAAVNTFYIVGEEIYYTSDNSNWKKIGGDAQNFDKLNNRPKYNSTLMTHNTNIPKVPTKASELAYTPASGSGIASTNIQGAINELANKMKNTITPSSQTNILYGTDSSANIAYYPFSDSKVNSSIAKRTNYGSLKVATPIEDDDATTKKYVDDKEVDLQNDIDTLGNTVSGINTRVGTLESTTSGLDSRLTTLNTTVTTMGNQVNTNKNDIALLKTKTDTLQTGVTQNANNISSLNTRVNQFDSRIAQNANDIQDEMTTRFDNDIKDISMTGASGNTILLTKNDDSTLATNIPMVSTTTNGLMTKEAYAAIQNNTQAIEDLKNMGGRYIGISFATKAQLDAYTIPSTVKVGDFTYISKDETHDNATSLYVCAMNGANKEFRFAYVIEHEAIGTATTTTKGIVMGSTANGKIFVETDGTMSLNGYDNIINSLGNKVDKVTGKDLSTNDYTNADKTKVGILTSTGTGNMYLADDGTYKTITIPDSGVQDIKVNGTSIVDSTGSADLHTIALSGSYNDLTNKPQNLVQDANYVHTDNNFTDDLFARVSVIDRTGLGNKALMDDASYRTLADVAFSGSYNDLINVPTNLVQDANYVHTDNNFTTTLKTKLENIDPTGEENIIESISLNGSTLTVDSNKNVDIDISNYALEEDVPTKTSDLTNDSNFVSDANYVHTDNNFTTTLKNKLNGIATGAQVNKIEIVKVDGNPLMINSADKSVNIALAGYASTDSVEDLEKRVTNNETNIKSLQMSGLWRGLFNTYADLPTNAKTSGPSFIGGTVYVNDYVIIKEDETHLDASRKPCKTRYYATAIADDGTITWTYFDKEEGSIATATNTSLGLVKGTTYNSTDETTIGKISVASDGTMSVNGIDDLGYLPLTGNSPTTKIMTGPIWFKNNIGGIYGTMGGSDTYRIVGGSTGEDLGYLELATADNGNEPIYVRQYAGLFESIKNIKNELILLDNNGDTILPGNLKLNKTSSSIIWNEGSIWQRIKTTDDGISGTAVFTFQQSLDKGVNYTDLATITDVGKIIATENLKTNAGAIEFKDKVTQQYNESEQCIEFIFN